ncbi:hypothetical protein GGI21_001970 [Coemansia aciculifera]|nr:hypothetical protein GGI21_001970 [Coemansia aciculifera]
MHRLSLAALCLQTKAHGVADTQRFLQLAVDPPQQSAVAGALAELKDAGALDDCEQLTPVGRHLCYLPVDLHVGKLLIAGALLGCLDPALTLAAAMSISASVFLAVQGSDLCSAYRRSPGRFLPYVRTGSEAASSDFLATLAVYEDWRAHATKSTGGSGGSDFCRRMAVSRDALEAIEDCREQYLRLLYERGLVHIDLSASGGISLARAIRPPPLKREGGGKKKKTHSFVVVPRESNANAQSLGVLYAALAMSLDHVIMPTASQSGYVIGQTHVPKRVEGIGNAVMVVDRTRVATRPLTLDHRSALHSSLSPPSPPCALIAGRLSAADGRSMVAHDVTRVGLAHMVLCASRELCYWPKARLLQVDRWIDVECYARSAVVLMALRRMLDEIVEFRTVGVTAQKLPKHLEDWMNAIILVLKN